MTFCSISHWLEFNSVPPAFIKALPVTFTEELREQAGAERTRAFPENAANYRPTFGIYQKFCCVSGTLITLWLFLFQIIFLVLCLYVSVFTVLFIFHQLCKIQAMEGFFCKDPRVFISIVGFNRKQSLLAWGTTHLHFSNSVAVFSFFSGAS